YGPAAQQLLQKVDRVLQRQKEKRQHEKNLQNGKKKPWAVPNSAQKKSAAPSGQRKGKGESSGAPETRSPRSGSPRPGQKHRPGPGGRKLSGTFRHKP
ncbi:MAG: 50S ribosomal protein L7, partial [Flintibacter sp.]